MVEPIAVAMQIIMWIVTITILLLALERLFIAFISLLFTTRYCYGIVKMLFLSSIEVKFYMIMRLLFYCYIKIKNIFRRNMVIATISGLVLILI